MKLPVLKSFMSSDWSMKQGVLALCALLFLFTEIGLRVINVASVQQRLDPVEFEQDRSPLQAHPYTAFACKPNWRSSPNARLQASHNSFGFRGEEIAWDKPEGTLRVLCLGGSSTYGEAVSSDENTWPSQLGTLLNKASTSEDFEVINLGVPGYTTFESLTQLATLGLELQPDVVLIYHAMGDLRAVLADSVAPDNTHFRTNWPTTYRGDLDALFEYSRVYRLARSVVTDNAVRRLEGDVIATRGDQSTESGLPHHQGFANYERNLRSMVALARSGGAKVFLINPAVDHRDLVGGKRYETRTMGLDRLYTIASRLADELEIGFIDGAAALEDEALRQIEETGSENIYEWEDRLRDPGAKLLALTIADALLAIERSF